MGLFSSKKSTSQVSNSTTNNFTDQSANAGGEGSIALAQGSNLTINSLDAGLASDALSSNATVAGSALAANNAVNQYAIGTVGQVADSALAANLANNKGAMELASQSLDLNAQGTARAFTFGNDALSFADTQNARAFDYVGDATGSILDSLNKDRQANQDLTASLARSAFSLADNKTQTASDQILNLGKIALYVVGALIAVFLLFRPSSSKA